MPCSEKKRQANRQNAQKSTGPKSKDGKAEVALNAVTHGLRSQQIVLPGEDAAAFDQMVASWMDDWKPPTDARRLLVEQAVAHAWRLRRCLKVERDHLIDRGRAAVRAYERSAAARAKAAIELLPRDPAAALEALLAEREGAVAVLGLWDELAEAATADGWHDGDDHHVRLLNLLGRDGDADAQELGGAVYGSWCLIEWNEPEPTEYADDRPADRAEADAIAAELAAFIAEQLAELREYLADRFVPAEEHAARVASQAALDDSAAGRALLRYEGQHGREFRATLNQLIKLTQTGIDLVIEDEPAAVDPAQAEAEPSVEPSAPPAPSQATEAEAAAPSKATEVRPEPPSAPNKATGEAPAGADPVGPAVPRYPARVAKPQLNL